MAEALQKLWFYLLVYTSLDLNILHRFSELFLVFVEFIYDFLIDEETFIFSKALWLPYFQCFVITELK